jgi:hypothetical protein
LFAALRKFVERRQWKSATTAIEDVASEEHGDCDEHEQDWESGFAKCADWQAAHSCDRRRLAAAILQILASPRDADFHRSRV